ncbi:hypothetical protein Dfri01_08600 [Dyadobacter frigoris]|uniref:lipocalin-like domain-containing protein n=1 Tax=Dyadobacter frigoris TaxID=2576211 RepID=UPI0024A10BB4|nr:lipocalin-like domain-containing protein [Dyadobacter frigoris]GLU51399.1 hypothetical protein Dfri01_08600 [Dyadobacter frigoris]
MKKLILLTGLLTIMIHAFAGKPQNNSTPDSTDLTGLWTLVTVENINPDGSKTLPYGISPKGLLVFDKSGNYAIQILKASRPKVEAGDKNKATPEENAALVKGNNSHFGTYKINKDEKTITFYVENAFYPNWEGTVQERFYTLSNNELKYIVRNTTNGGDITAVVIWKKMI